MADLPRQTSCPATKIRSGNWHNLFGLFHGLSYNLSMFYFLGNYTLSVMTCIVEAFVAMVLSSLNNKESVLYSKIVCTCVWCHIKQTIVICQLTCCSLTVSLSTSWTSAIFIQYLRVHRCRSGFSKLDICEGWSFWTATFNSDIQLSVYSCSLFYTCVRLLLC